MVKFVFLAALAAVPFAVTASVPPPVLPLKDHVTWAADYAQPPASNLRLGKLTLQFEQSTLSAIAKAVGKGKIAHQGDAAASIYWLCYSTPTSRVWLVSSGEMGGTSHVLTRISAVSQPHAAPEAACPMLPGKFRPISIFKKLRLEQPASRFSGALGAPTHMYRSWRMYGHAGKVILGGGCLPEGFDQYNWLWYEVTNHRVVRISAGQVTSC